MENYSYNSYAESGESSPRSRELEYENSGAASWEDQPLHHPSKVKFMCSYGGKIQPRPHDNQLSYVGGETKILSVDRSIKFSSLINKLCALCEADVCFKYQLPGEDLDALISVTTDDDLEHMMHEYDRLCRPSSKPARLRLFLFPATPPSVCSGDMKTERERFVEALNSVPIQSVDVISPPAAAPPGNVDLLFGLEQGVAPPAPMAKLPIPVPEQPAPVEIPSVVNQGGEGRVFAADLGANPAEIQRQIQDLKKLQISAQEQGLYQRKNDENMFGGYAGDYYVQKMPEKAPPPSTLPANIPATYWQEKRVPAGGGYPATVQATPGLTEQPVYMISAPAGVYHTPATRQVTGQPGQGYYAMRMGPDVYREQPPVYSMVQQTPVPANMPTPAPKLPTYSEGPGMVRPTGVGMADVGYTQVGYDSQGRQVYYTAQGGVVGPYQAMAAVGATSGPLNQESGKAIPAKVSQASV